MKNVAISLKVILKLLRTKSSSTTTLFFPASSAGAHRPTLKDWETVVEIEIDGEKEQGSNHQKNISTTQKEEIKLI